MSSNEGMIQVDSEVRLFFRKIGDHEKVILIPNGMYFFDEFQQFANTHSLIFYDVRNRGFSDPVNDPAKLRHGVHQDVEDLEAVRKYFGLEKIYLIGHSYIGLMIGLYAIKYQIHVEGVIQIGASQPDGGKQYPSHLTNTDDVTGRVFQKIGEMQKEKEPEDRVERCRKFWSILNEIYVADPKNAVKLHWGRCELQNERNAMKYWTEIIFPSLQNIHLKAEELTDVKPPFLIIHGLKDRSAPYGGGREWSFILPNARILSLENVAHAPWIEAPDAVFPAIREFLDGHWPAGTEKVMSLA